MPSQLRQIGQGLLMYDKDNKKLPYELVALDAAGNSVSLYRARGLIRGLVR